ncbi:MAG TPA: glycosyltransferase family 2 protein [Patescibacteria group bacterium]|nr:glycosyltransferase family 2 protein [Patescibacteria group bacterium]
MENSKNYKKTELNNGTPFVFVIVLNWNGIKDTTDCLQSLNKINYKNFKVIIIDNGSKDNEIKKLKKHFPKNIYLSNNKNQGYCKANNQGIKYAIRHKADYILLLNNDTVVDKNFLKFLIAYAVKNKFEGILTSKIFYFGTNLIWSMGGVLSKISGIPRMIGQGQKATEFKKVIIPDYAPGCVFFAPVSVFKKSGLLNEIYFAYYEDLDYCSRARKLGITIRAIPESVVFHKVSRSTNSKSLRKMGKLQSYLIARNGILFGSINLQGFERSYYIVMQIILKLPLYLLFKVENFQSGLSYIQGVYDGVKFMLDKKITSPIRHLDS